MKRDRVILLLFFAALLVGCGGSYDARITAELDRADSLLRTCDTAAHSAALRQMLALDTARALQADEALRARHALLLVQARYKCYVTEPADSALIDSALSYYTDHHGSSADHERYTRALIYSGAVAEELGHPQQAMQHYLEAESTADPNDHFNLGYINGRIAGIYESEYTTDSTDLVRYKKALSHFRKAGDIYWQATCLTGIGGLYRTHNNDSAFHYLQQAISFSKKHGLTYNYYKSLDKLCGLYYYMEDYTKSKDLATKIYQENQGVYDDTQYLSFGIRSFAKLGMADSAEYYFKYLPIPQNLVDSVELLDVIADIQFAKHDYLNYSSSIIRSSQIADSLILNSCQMQLKDTEDKYKNSVLQLNIAKLKNTRLMLIIVILGCLIVLYAFIARYRSIREQAESLDNERTLLKHELDERMQDLQMAEQILNQKESEKKQLLVEMHTSNMALQQALQAAHGDNGVKLLCSLRAVLKELSDKLDYNDNDVSLFTAIFTKRKSFNLSVRKLSNSFWEEVENVANLSHNSIISHVRDVYSNCSESDIRYIALYCLGFSNEVIKVCLGYTNIKTVSNYKYYIINKLTGKHQSIDDFIDEYIHKKGVN